MIKCIITDLRISRKPELKTSGNGKNYTRILASAYLGKDMNGNKKYQNVNLTLFGKAAERAAQDLSEGSLVNVYGSAETSAYTKQDGSAGHSLNITADTYEQPLGSRSHEDANRLRSAGTQGNPYARQQAQAPAPASNEDDDLPF